MKDKTNNEKKERVKEIINSCFDDIIELNGGNIKLRWEIETPPKYYMFPWSIKLHKRSTVVVCIEKLVPYLEDLFRIFIDTAPEDDTVKVVIYEFEKNHHDIDNEQLDQYSVKLENLEYSLTKYFFNKKLLRAKKAEEVKDIISKCLDDLKWEWNDQQPTNNLLPEETRLIKSSPILFNLFKSDHSLFRIYIDTDT